MHVQYILCRLGSCNGWSNVSKILLWDKLSLNCRMVYGEGNGSQYTPDRSLGVKQTWNDGKSTRFSPGFHSPSLTSQQTLYLRVQSSELIGVHLKWYPSTTYRNFYHCHHSETDYRSQTLILQFLYICRLMVSKLWILLVQSVSNIRLKRYWNRKLEFLLQVILSFRNQAYVPNY